MNIIKVWFDSKLRYLNGGWIFACALLMSGCVTVIQPPSLQNTEDKVISKELAQESWAQVLTQSVDSRGRVAFKSVSENPASLHRMISYVSQTSPENKPGQFVSSEDRLAYYLNSYNALAMYGVISYNFPSDFNGFTDRAKFFAFTDFTIGGREISLYDYENKVIRPLGDPRVHFALNCMVRACPRLPQTPFQAGDLDDTLNSLAREFVNDPRHVQVVESSRRVRLSEILSFYEEDFVNPKTATSLIAYINRYRKKPIDETFTVEFIPYDWTVNYQ
jgi:hypothetical protein